MPNQATKKKVEYTLFDELKFQKRNDQGFSWYTGDQGEYLIQRLKATGKTKPVAKMYLNRKYLTGVFKTRDKKSFSGDIKGDDKKRVYLKIEFTGQVVKLYKRS